MENPFMPYEMNFTEDERKQLIAQALAEYRKAKKLSQKEVAGLLGISQATYSTYERGRTEPPIELLVRLSYLYNVTVDALVQRERLVRNTGEIQMKVEEYRKQLTEIAEQCDDSPEGRIASETIDALQRMLTMTENINAMMISKQL